MEKSGKRGKIPQSDWPLIMARYEAGETLSSIARTYDCSPPAISYIVSRSRAKPTSEISAPPTTEPQLVKSHANGDGPDGSAPVEPTVVPPEPMRRQSGLVPFQSDAAMFRRASDRAINVDVIFPVLHGTFGEDGTIQGLLELADIPYVGAGVLGSAAGMDKDIMKSLFLAAGIPIVKHVTILRSAWENDPKQVQKRVESRLIYPVFVKPANLGSSVGISKAHNRKELGPAIEEAAKFDRKIVIEQGVGGKKEKARELECSVLGNDEPAASVPGEIVPGKEFYDYTAKYVDEGSQLIIPAKLTKAQTKRVQELAIAAFKAVDCSGLARVDFLMDPKTEKIYLNEINTMPGFTAISMYPKLWASSGLAYPDLIDRLIQLGIERHEDKKKNQYSR